MNLHWLSSLSFSSGGGVGWGIGGFGFMSISIDQFNTDLLGKSKFDLLAGGGSQFGVAFLDGDWRVFDLWDSDGSIFNNVFAGDTGKRDWFVNAGLDGFRVSNFYGDIDGGDNRHVVSGGLGNFLAVVVSIRSISVSMVSRLADSDHLDIFFLFEGHFDSLGGSFFSFLLVSVRTDFIGDDVDGFSTHCTGDLVVEFFVDNDFDGQFNGGTDSFESWDAHIGDFSYVLNCAVVFGFFITITSIMRSGVSISGGMVAIGGGRGVVGGGLVIATVMRGGNGVGWAASDEGEECQDSEGLEI
jgi:hypothetical protein